MPMELVDLPTRRRAPIHHGHPMLYRAIAYLQDPAGPLADAEVYVFFEATPADCLDRVTRLLSRAWIAPPHCIEAYNVNSEPELLTDWAMGPAGTGDARLFESGFDVGRVTYIPPDRTLMFVRPGVLRRLVAAQQLVASLLTESLRTGVAA